mmetsp:Transcript_44923/g.83846  ORF Transcript_44923/g.83846 Transcript_44923/m.83846 type:complete len:466 (+) Transcript_44923:65-1462(+)
MPTTRHVVIVMMPSTGHVNPALPIMAELTSRGVLVTCYIHEQFQKVVQAVGVNWRPMQRPHYLTDEQAEKYLQGQAKDSCMFPASAMPVAAAVLPSLIQELQSLQPKPNLIAYDPFLPQGLVAAIHLQLPSVCLLSYTGPGVVHVPASVTESWESSDAVRLAWKEIKDAYNVDLFQHGTVSEFYSPNKNTVTTFEGLFAPPESDVQKQRFGHLSFRCIGPMVMPSGDRISHAWASEDQLAKKLPWQSIHDALAQSKRLLFLSLGTVATSSFWARKFGPNAVSNGLEDFSGKEFVHFVLRTAFEAFAGEQDLLVIAATGPQPDALQDLPSPPPNFILQEVVPQLEVLSKCHAFVTHGGANSLHEALALGVPLVIVPMFGDQPFNADAVAAMGAAVSFRHPTKTLSPATLRGAVRRILDPQDDSFRAAAQRLASQLAGMGGAKQAVDFMLGDQDESQTLAFTSASET